LVGHAPIGRPWDVKRPDPDTAVSETASLRPRL